MTTPPAATKTPPTLPPNTKLVRNGPRLCPFPLSDLKAVSRLDKHKHVTWIATLPDGIAEPYIQWTDRTVSKLELDAMRLIFKSRLISARELIEAGKGCTFSVDQDTQLPSIPKELFDADVVPLINQHPVTTAADVPPEGDDAPAEEKQQEVAVPDVSEKKRPREQEQDAGLEVPVQKKVKTTRVPEPQHPILPPPPTSPARKVPAPAKCSWVPANTEVTQILIERARAVKVQTSPEYEDILNTPTADIPNSEMSVVLVVSMLAMDMVGLGSSKPVHRPLSEFKKDEFSINVAFALRAAAFIRDKKITPLLALPAAVEVGPNKSFIEFACKTKGEFEANNQHFPSIFGECESIDDIAKVICDSMPSSCDTAAAMSLLDSFIATYIHIK
jgi:hypothetical protein